MQKKCGKNKVLVLLEKKRPLAGTNVLKVLGFWLTELSKKYNSQ